MSNPNHDRLGQFASGSGSGSAASVVRPASKRRGPTPQAIARAQRFRRNARVGGAVVGVLAAATLGVAVGQSAETTARLRVTTMGRPTYTRRTSVAGLKAATRTKRGVYTITDTHNVRPFKRY